MEILLLGIYSFFVWLVFFKFKWLPWNIVTQVITITIPMVGLTVLILLLNIVAPSSHDVRVVNYVVPVNPPVRAWLPRCRSNQTAQSRKATSCSKWIQRLLRSRSKRRGAVGSAPGPTAHRRNELAQFAGATERRNWSEGGP